MSKNKRLTEEHIKRHIHFFVNAKVADSGQQLYNKGKVRFTDFIEKADAWKLKVRDSAEFSVMVKGVNSKSIQLSCTSTLK